jgi:hypothetical protein
MGQRLDKMLVCARCICLQQILPVMDFEEPPLQAEIMMSISMTLSLILNSQYRHGH